MGLQLFVTNLSINSIFLSALSSVRTQGKILSPFSVCRDAAAQPADAALLSNSRAGNGSYLFGILALPRSEISSFLVQALNACRGS